MLGRASSRAKPRPPVVLAWGSQSINKVERPSRARAAAQLMAVVVLPTPPFWLTTAMTLDGLAASGVVAGSAASDVGWSASEGCVGLFLGWMGIIGVSMRVSGAGFGGTPKGV